MKPFKATFLIAERKDSEKGTSRKILAFYSLRNVLAGEGMVEGARSQLVTLHLAVRN